MQKSGAKHSQSGKSNNYKSQSKVQEKRKRLIRFYCIGVVLLALFISLIAVWASTETLSKANITTDAAGKTITTINFDSDTRIMLFSPIEGQWKIAVFDETKPENEFYFNNQLYRVVDSDKAQLVPKIDAVKLFEADRRLDLTSDRPEPSDAVQVLDKDNNFTAHAILSTVTSGSKIRFQGRAYIVKSDRSLVNTGMAFSASTSSIQRIEITRSAWQHINDRHTVGGSKNAGASIFNPGEDIQTLIKNAQLQIPIMEENGYVKRVFDAGRDIGYGTKRGRQVSTSTYFVITTQSGKLVTSYPVVQ